MTLSNYTIKNSGGRWIFFTASPFTGEMLPTLTANSRADLLKQIKAKFAAFYAANIEKLKETKNMKNKTNLQRAKAIVKALGRGRVARDMSYQISQNKTTGEIFVDEYCGCNSWSAYLDPDIETLFFINGDAEGDIYYTVANIVDKLEQERI